MLSLMPSTETIKGFISEHPGCISVKKRLGPSNGIDYLNSIGLFICFPSSKVPIDAAAQT